MDWENLDNDNGFAVAIREREKEIRRRVSAVKSGLWRNARLRKVN